MCWHTGGKLADVSRSPVLLRSGSLNGGAQSHSRLLAHSPAFYLPHASQWVHVLLIPHHAYVFLSSYLIPVVLLPYGPQLAHFSLILHVVSGFRFLSKP